MTAEELKDLEKTCKKLNAFRILAVPVLAFILLLIDIVLIVVLPENSYGIVFFIIVFGAGLPVATYGILNAVYKKKVKTLNNSVEKSIVQTLGIGAWKYTYKIDDQIDLNSGRAVEGYDDIKYFKENPDRLAYAFSLLKQKKEYASALRNFIENNEYQDLKIYDKYKKQIEDNLLCTDCYYVRVHYSSPTGRSQNGKLLNITESRLKALEEDKSLLMTKAEYNKYVKDQASEKLEEKKHQYYQRVNEIIDFANEITKEIYSNISRMCHPILWKMMRMVSIQGLVLQLLTRIL